MAINRVIRIHNLQSVADTYAGQVVQASGYYQIQSESERQLFADDVKLNQHIWATSAAIDDGSGIDFDPAAGDAWLKMIEQKVTDASGKEVIHQTPRDLEFITYFCGADDDHNDPHAVGSVSGGSVDLCWDHQVSGANPETIYLDFNTANNETHMHAGFIQWQNAQNDYVTLSFVPKTTAYSAGSNTNYNLFGGYLIVPALGDGVITVNDADRVLVEVPKDLDKGGYVSSGYWDAEWDTATKQYINIVPNYFGTGQFNMFGYAVTMNRFIYRQHLLGEGFMHLPTYDKSQLPQNVRVKLEIYTRQPDHAWSGNATVILHRKKTI